MTNGKPAEQDQGSKQSRSVAPVSFEEFKMFVESADRVTDQRDALNRFYYTVAVALVIAVAAIANLVADTAPLRLASLMLVLTLSTLAFLFCNLWVYKLVDLKKLNAAKFQVLAEMAPRIAFDSPDGNLAARSYEPFAREWELLQESTTKRRGLTLLQGSAAELFVPRGFQIIFATIFMTAVGILILNFDVVVSDARFTVDSGSALVVSAVVAKGAQC